MYNVHTYLHVYIYIYIRQCDPFHIHMCLHGCPRSIAPIKLFCMYLRCLSALYSCWYCWSYWMWMHLSTCYKKKYILYKYKYALICYDIFTILLIYKMYDINVGKNFSHEIIFTIFSLLNYIFFILTRFFLFCLQLRICDDVKCNFSLVDKNITE